MVDRSPELWNQMGAMIGKDEDPRFGWGDG
jgi:hypothetical protein